MEANRLFQEFTRVRQDFEVFLLKHKVLVNQTVIKFGSGLMGLGRLHSLFAHIFNLLREKKTEMEVIASFRSTASFTFLQPSEQDEPGRSRDFDADTKSEIFLRDALRDPLRCRICNGLVHINSISIDHIVRKADGGFGVVDNGQLTHPSAIQPSRGKYGV